MKKKASCVPYQMILFVTGRDFVVRYSDKGLLSRWKTKFAEFIFFSICLLFILLYGVPIILIPNESFRYHKQLYIYGARK
jgi:hypothetical protein